RIVRPGGRERQRKGRFSRGLWSAVSIAALVAFPAMAKEKTKAAMLAALQSTAGSQAVPSIIQPIEKVSLARRPLR
ncbi:MAG TPA: hypothetical protein VFE78_14330, partial [Gemmataceae bacterium]|nr:hypothetical protein [Gemmataceae bacterium]